MLVLSRKVDEKILVGNDIVLTVVAIRGNVVRIGIDAPSNLGVHRQEVFEAIQNSEAGIVPVAEAATDAPE